MKHKLFLFLQKLSADTSLRSKLMLIYFLLLLLPLGIFTFYVYHRVSLMTQEQTLTAASRTFDETSAAVENYFVRLQEVLSILALDDLVYYVSANDQSDYSKRLTDSDQLITSFEHLKTLSGVDNIRLYVKNDYLYSNQRQNIIYTIDPEDLNLFLPDSPSSPESWLAPADFALESEEEQDWFSAARVIYNPRAIHEPLAVLRADVRLDRMEKAIETTVTEEGGFLLLRGPELLLHSGSIPSDELLPAMIAGIQEHEDETWNQISAGGRNYYVFSRTLHPANWKIATLLPVSDVLALSRELRTELLVIVIALGAAAYAAACIISSSSLRRLSLLTQTMARVEKGDVSARITPIGEDEIGQLMSGFEHMMIHMDALMKEKVEYGRQVQNLELKALQAQINPHFLYNTLDLISCTAILHHVPQISRMVNALAQFYKISLSKGREVISIREELKHASLYLQLQNMRFEDRIHVCWEIEEEICGCSIIKIVLQPLIENAVIHGIFEKKEKTGTLHIEGRKDGNDILILITDDGVGMDEATRLQNFTPTPEGQIPHTRGGYGVRNVNDRLRLAYGVPYGLSCESRPGQGTRVTIRIPALPAESADNHQKGD